MPYVILEIELNQLPKSWKEKVNPDATLQPPHKDGNLGYNKTI